MILAVRAYVKAEGQKAHVAMMADCHIVSHELDPISRPLFCIVISGE